MKNSLKEKLTPFLDNFIEGIVNEYDKAKDRQAEVSKEVQKFKDMQENLKVQKNENNFQSKLSRDKLEKERIKQTGLNNEIKVEISRYEKLKNELENNKKAIQENLKDAELNNQKISGVIAKTKKKEEEYQTLIDILKKDQEKLNAKNLELINLEKKLKREDKINIKNQEALALKGMELNEKDLRVKARDQEVKRLVKMYKLEKKVKNYNE